MEDCNDALNLPSSYSKARLRRADCNAKLKIWEASRQDYEILLKETPEDEQGFELSSQLQFQEIKALLIQEREARVVFTSVPKVMVERFLKKYLSVGVVIGTKLYTVGCYFSGLLFESSLLVKYRTLKDYFGDRKLDNKIYI